MKHFETEPDWHRMKTKNTHHIDGYCISGGERGIRTPVTVFAVNMISNHAPSTTRTPLQIVDSAELTLSGSVLYE